MVGDSYQEKLKRLKKILRRMESVLVAYSGGVDSTFLLKMAQEILKEKVLAVIGESETYPLREVRQAIRIAKGFRVPYIVIRTHELRDRRFVRNPRDRCYWCKRELFSQLSRLAKERGIAYVVDGTNYDDLADFRPGSKAAEEFVIRRPFVEARIGKNDIRVLSRRKGLITWDKPSFACLASRFPYGMRIDKDALSKINKAEEYVMGLGVAQVRVRHYGPMARIEVLEGDMLKIFKERRRITRYLKKLGYAHIALDLGGYRTGSMNVR